MHTADGQHSSPMLYVFQHFSYHSILFCVLSITWVASLTVIYKKIWSSEKSPFETHGFQRSTNTETKPLPLIKDGAEGIPVVERTNLGFGKTLAVSCEMKEGGLHGSEQICAICYYHKLGTGKKQCGCQCKVL